MFGSSPAVFAALNFWINSYRVALFWGASILSHPLGAIVGDFLDSSLGKGSLELSQPLTWRLPRATTIALIVAPHHRPLAHLLRDGIA